MKIDLTNHEATLIYELLHEIKLKCVSAGTAEEKKQARRIIKDCNGLMKKVEDIVLSPNTGEGRKKKKASSKGDK